MGLYIGVDPGVGGGIAVIDEAGLTVEVTKMPETDGDLLSFFGVYGGKAIAALEFVRSSPQMGVASAFTFGRGYGALRMALQASRIPYTEVTPPKWQQRMGCRSKGDKNVTKARAQELFPGLKVTHATADALLLASYCRLAAAPEDAGF